MMSSHINALKRAKYGDNSQLHKRIKELHLYGDAKKHTNNKEGKDV